MRGTLLCAALLLLGRRWDRQQGELLARYAAAYMRGFPLDDTFRAQVPEELRRYLVKFPQVIREAGA